MFVDLTLLLAGRVGEVQHSVFLQSSRRHHRIHQRVVEEQVIYGQGQTSVIAAHHHATPAVVVVLVPHIDDDAAVRHLDRLRSHRDDRKRRFNFLVYDSDKYL